MSHRLNICLCIITILIIIFLLTISFVASNFRLRRFIKSIDTNGWQIILEKINISENTEIRRNAINSEEEQLVFLKNRDLICIRRIDENSMVFVFSWSYHGGEQFQCFLYQKMDGFCYSLIDAEMKTDSRWKLSVTNDEIKITGGGANGHGYITISRVLPNWFFYESYLPT